MEKNIRVTSRLVGEYTEKLKVKVKYKNFVHMVKRTLKYFLILNIHENGNLTN